MNRRAFLASGAVLIATAHARYANAQAPATRTIPVRFARGARSASFRGTLQGYDTVDYALTARAGQSLSVALRGGNESTEVAVFTPSGGDLEMTVTDGLYTGELPETGRYRVRVLIMRNDARRGAISRYSLTIGID
jgi:hypothetical protein